GLKRTSAGGRSANWFQLVPDWSEELDLRETSGQYLAHAAYPSVSNTPRLAPLVVAGLAFHLACAPPSTQETGKKTPAAAAGAAGPRSTRYEDLVTLFADWRTFQRPKIVRGVPDYSA